MKRIGSWLADDGATDFAKGDVAACGESARSAVQAVAVAIDTNAANRRAILIPSPEAATTSSVSIGRASFPDAIKHGAKLSSRPGSGLPDTLRDIWNEGFEASGRKIQRLPLLGAHVRRPGDLNDPPALL